MMLLFLSILCYATASVPEADMTTVQIIAYHGYPVQEVKAITADGYTLIMHRIPFGKKPDAPKRSSKSRKTKKPVVLLQHGLLASSADWVLNMPEQSLGFMLADAGCDVYLANSRGNIYSQGHINASVHAKEYWQFSWDEMARYDLPAMIDRVLEMSGQDSLYYVGYSQGTTIMFTGASKYPEIAKKVKKFFALAPVVTVKDAEGLLTKLGRMFLPEIELLIRLTGENQFLPNNFVSKLFSKLVCGSSWTNPLCANILFLIVGPESNQLNMTRLSAYLEHSPAGTSTQNIIHWAQMVISGKAQMYSWPTAKENQLHYGQAEAPLYDLSNFSIPIYLYYSDADWLSDKVDVQHLLKLLSPQYVARSRHLEDFNHIDFVYGLRAAKEIYEDVVDSIVRAEFNRVRG